MKVVFIVIFFLGAAYMTGSSIYDCRQTGMESTAFDVGAAALNAMMLGINIGGMFK